MKNRYYDLSDKKLREFIFNKYGGKCAYCGCKLTRFHIDHIRPIKRYDMGNDDKTKLEILNLNPSCPSCNISKSYFELEDWRKELELKIERIKRDSPTFRHLLNFGLVKIVNYNVVFYFETL